MRSRQMLIKLGGLHLPATEAGCPDLIGCLAAVASSRLTMIFSRAGSDNPSAKAKRPCCQLANGSGAWPVRGRRGCRATFRSGRSVPASRPARGPPMRQTPPTGPPPEGLRRQAASPASASATRGLTGCPLQNPPAPRRPAGCLPRFRPIALAIAPIEWPTALRIRRAPEAEVEPRPPVHCAHGFEPVETADRAF